jgi:hypothetical protein
MRRFRNAAGRSDRTSESQLPIALELSSAASSGSLFASGMALARAAAANEQTVVLVEGISDQVALNALARRLNWDAQTESIAIVAMGGATNVGHFLDLLAPLGVQIAGLCDRGEENRFQRALERTGFGVNLTRSKMEALGFYVCDADLEDELIRAVGVDAVLKVVATQDELEAFRTFQRQHAWQHQRGDAQLRRWLGAKTLRKFRYATLLVEALDLDRIPKRMERLLAHVRDHGGEEAGS